MELLPNVLLYGAVWSQERRREINRVRMCCTRNDAGACLWGGMEPRQPEGESMDANGIKAALWLANDAYPVVLVSESIKGETIIHLGPMSVPSIVSIPIGDVEIEWLGGHVFP